MKSTTLTALALTLLMFLLVLLAAFLFLFQGQLALRDSLSSSDQDNEALRQERAQLEIEQSASQATTTALQATVEVLQSEQATVAAEREELRMQLVATDHKVATLEAQLEEVTQERDVAQGTKEAYESVGPFVEMIEPQQSTVATVGEPLTLVVVASDVVGVRSVNINIGNELLDVEVTPGQSVTVRRTWTPQSSGSASITVSAVNRNNITSQPEVVTIDVQNPAPTSTPTPTLEPTPTP